MDDCLSDMSTGTLALAQNRRTRLDASIGWTDLPNRWKRVCLRPKKPSILDPQGAEKKLMTDLSLSLAAERSYERKAYRRRFKKWDIWCYILPLLCKKLRKGCGKFVNSVTVTSTKLLFFTKPDNTLPKSCLCSSSVHVNICSPTSCQVFMCECQMVVTSVNIVQHILSKQY